MPPGSNGVVGLFSNVMQASRWAHTTPGFIGFDVANPDRSGPHRVLPFNRGGSRLRLARPRPDHRGGGELHGRRGGLHRWRGERPPVATDHRGHAGDTAAHSCREGVDRSWCGDMRRCRCRALERTPMRPRLPVAAFERTVEPDPEASAAYKALADEWLKIYRTLDGACGVRPRAPVVACRRRLTDSYIGGNMPETDTRTDKNFFLKTCPRPTRAFSSKARPATTGG